MISSFALMFWLFYSCFSAGTCCTKLANYVDVVLGDSRGLVPVLCLWKALGGLSLPLHSKLLITCKILGIC